MNLDRSEGPDWKALPREGCVAVEVKVLLSDGSRLLAMLRFGRHATIDEHPGDDDAIVFCLDGSGYVSVGEEQAPFVSGDRVAWPKGIAHRLWTEDTEMTTLMFHPNLPRDPSTGRAEG